MRLGTYILIAAPSQRLWLALVGALEAPALANDSRFESVGARSQHSKALEQALNAILAADDAESWISRLTRAGVPVNA